MSCLSVCLLGFNEGSVRVAVEAVVSACLIAPPLLDIPRVGKPHEHEVSFRVVLYRESPDILVLVVRWPVQGAR